MITIGVDLKEELPVLYLRVRDAVEKRKTRLLEISHCETGLSKYAYRSIRHVPGEQAAAARSVLADETAQLEKGPVVLIVGRGSVAESARFTTDAVGVLLAGLPGTKVIPALRRGNVIGAIQAGMTPGNHGQNAAEIIKAAAAGDLRCLVLVGADPLSDFPDRNMVEEALKRVSSVIAVDTFLNESSAHAQVVLAAAGYGERDGSTTNVEGRVLPLTQKVTPKGVSRPDWLIARDLADALGESLDIESLDDAHEAYLEAVAASVGATMIDGGTVAPTRGGYDLRLVAKRELYDNGVQVQTSPSLAGLPRGAVARLSTADANRLGITTDTPVRITDSRGRSLRVPARRDDGVPTGAVVLSFQQDDSVADLIDANASVNDVKVDLA